jgi:hypothetical protein
MNEESAHVDFEATEMAIRTAMRDAGGMLLEKLLDLDHGYRGPSVPCGKHTAEFVDYRNKSVLTVLSRITVRRAYYHCALCHAGVIPKDSDLDIVSTSFSPGVRRLMGRLGGKVAFAEGRLVLEELAGIVVNTKEVERVAEAIGEQIEAIAQKERAAARASIPHDWTRLITMRLKRQMAEQRGHEWLSFGCLDLPAAGSRDMANTSQPLRLASQERRRVADGTCARIKALAEQPAVSLY